MQSELQYCATEQDLVGTASRLEMALQRKIGHVVVIGDDQDDVNIFVSVVLDGIFGFEPIELSAEQLELPEVPKPAAGMRAIAVVYNSDLLTSEALEELRQWTEQSSTAIGLLLIGTLALARTLVRPESKILAGLIHTRIVLARRELDEAEQASAQAPGRSFVSSLILTGMAAIGVGLVVGTQDLADQPLVNALADAFANGIAWVLAHAGSLAAN